MASFVISSYQYSGSAGQTSVVASAATLTTGDHVVVGVKWLTNDATVTVTDTAGNTYVPLTKYKKTGFNLWVQLFYCLGATGHASNQVTATFTGATVDFPDCHWAAFDAPGTAAIVDEAVGETGAAGMSVTTASMDATDNAAIFAMGGHTGTGALVAGAGYTGLHLISGQGGSEYRIVAAGSYTAGFTHASNRNMLMAAAVLQDTAGSGGSNYTMPIDAASLVLSGKEIPFALRQPGTPGSLLFTGRDVALSVTGSQSMPIEPASLLFTGRDVTLTISEDWPGGEFDSTGTAVRGNRRRRAGSMVHAGR